VRHPKVPLGEVLELVLDEVVVEPLGTYPMAGVYSFGKGLFAREPITGSETSYQKLSRLHEGQFVYSRLFAWEGAVAVVTREFDGLFLSQEFPTFRIDPQRATPEYLTHIARWPTFHVALAGNTRGLGLRRQRVHPEQLLAIEIPLPSLDEQRRIAERIDRLVRLAERVRSSSQSVGDERLRSMIPGIIDHELTRVADAWQELGDVADFVSDVFKPGDPLEPAEAFVGLQHVEPHTGKAVGWEPVGNEKGPKHRFAPGDITYPRLRPYQNKVWLADRHGLCSVDQYVLRPKADMSGRILTLAMRSKAFLEAAMDATSRLQHPRIRKKDLSAIKVPVVDSDRAPAVEQRVAELTTGIGRLAHLRSQNAVRLGALDVSILNQAFNGQI
jgi:hypothetical protein